jgi:hypothetical protein
MKWMRKGEFIRNFEIYFFLVAALLIIPGNTSGVFNGLPLSSIPELSGFIILLFGIFSSRFKSNFKRVSAKVSLRYLVAIILIFGIAIPAKFALKHSDLPTGRFDACYHSYVRSDDMKVPECEPFFSAKFEGGRSRLDERVNFQGLNYPLRDINVSGSNWNLSFINNEQYLGRYGNFEQVRHPFRANWSGKFSVNVDNGFIPVTYVGYGSIRIDSSVTTLPVHYGFPKTEWIPVSKGIHSIKIDYSFTSLQMKPVNGVDYSSYGYYATLKIGAVQNVTSSLVDTLFGWAVDPQTFQRLSKILLVENEKVVQQVIPTTYRADVADYLDVKFENPYIGFSIYDAQPKAGSRIVGISADGKRHVLLRGDGKTWLEEPAVSRERLWYRIDDSFDSGERFGALKPESAKQGLGLLVPVLDALIGFLLLGVLGSLAWSFRRFWAAYVLLLIGILSHKFLLHSKIGWGYDGVEGSAMFYTSLLVVLAVLLYAVFIKPKSFVSLGILGSAYLAVDRITQINPGMRYDHFLPVTGKSFASDLSAVFFRSAATDWTIHAANTRSALFRGLLFGNEPVFYLQPGYRYFAPIFHYLFGDGDVRISIAVMFATLVGIVLLLNIFIENGRTIFDRFIAYIFLTGALFFATSWVMSYFILVQTTEIPTWPLMLLGSYVAIRRRNSKTGLFIPGMMFGLAVCMRPNQIIGHVVLLLVLSLLIDLELAPFKKLIHLAQRFAAMGLFSALPLAHNLYFGNQFVVFSTSRAGGSFDISAASDHILRYLYVFSRPLRSGDLTSQGIMGLPGSGYSKSIWFAVAVFLFVWIISVAQTVRVRKKWIFLFAILVPFSYLLPIIPYHAYFPRHAVAFWLSLIVMVVAVKDSLNSEISGEEKAFSNNSINHF